MQDRCGARHHDHCPGDPGDDRARRAPPVRDSRRQPVRPPPRDADTGCCDHDRRDRNRGDVEPDPGHQEQREHGAHQRPAGEEREPDEANVAAPEPDDAGRVEERVPDGEVHQVERERAEVEPRHFFGPPSFTAFTPGPRPISVVYGTPRNSDDFQYVSAHCALWMSVV